MFGRPLIMMPRQVTRSAKSTGSPSTVNATSPRTDILKPVAVTTTSAGISSPEPPLLPGAHPYPVLGERLDGVGDDRGLPLAQRREHVAVWDHGDALLPRAVAGREVLVDVEVLGQ